jgi:hypothetical protein
MLCGLQLHAPSPAACGVAWPGPCLTKASLRMTACLTACTACICSLLLLRSACCMQQHYNRCVHWHDAFLLVAACIRWQQRLPLVDVPHTAARMGVSQRPLCTLWMRSSYSIVAVCIGYSSRLGICCAMSGCGRGPGGRGGVLMREACRPPNSILAGCSTEAYHGHGFIYAFRRMPLVCSVERSQGGAQCST